MTGIPLHKNCGIPLPVTLWVMLLFVLPVSADTPPPIDAKRAQFLPISGTATIKGKVFMLEVALTSAEQSQGLMFRPPLLPNRGMAFPFSPPRTVAFWMKNTPVPLDMIFLKGGKVQALESQVPPCTTDPCPAYPPRGVVADLVIEVRAGTTTALGLKVGDAITVKWQPPSKK